jgi:hypothetical protein
MNIGAAGGVAVADGCAGFELVCAWVATFVAEMTPIARAAAATRAQGRETKGTRVIDPSFRETTHTLNRVGNPLQVGWKAR